MLVPVRNLSGDPMGVVAVFRFNLIGRAFGRHVLTQLFRYLTWALPVLVVSSVGAIILIAMA